MVDHCWEDVLGEQERFVSQMYAGSRPFRGSRALLLVDLYNAAFGESRAEIYDAVEASPSSCGLAAWDALPVLEQLLEQARACETLVLHTVADESPVTRGQVTLRNSRHPEVTTPCGSSWGNTIVDALQPIEGELVVAKSRSSAFFGTILDSYLRSAGVGALIVVGESTSGCVRATVLDAHSLGFDVVVVEEATFDRSPLSHQMALFDMHCKYATVVHQPQGLSLIADSSGDLTLWT